MSAVWNRCCTYEFGWGTKPVLLITSYDDPIKCSRNLFFFKVDVTVSNVPSYTAS
jgi:hypothetical protein